MTPSPNELMAAIVTEIREAIVETPLRLAAKAGPGVMHDPHSRYWLQHGRMQLDFAFPIEVPSHGRTEHQR